MGGLSISHLLIVLVIALLLFGAGRVSDIGKGLGEGIRNFKKGLREEDDAPAPRVTVRRKDDDAEPQATAETPKLTAGKKRVIQIEVDDDEDEDEVLRRLGKKKTSNDEKTT